MFAHEAVIGANLAFAHEAVVGANIVFALGEQPRVRNGRSGPIKIAGMMIAAAAIATIAGTAPALDVVVLNSGTEMRGEIIAKTDAAVRLNLLPGEMSLPAAEIKQIRTEENPGWYLNRIRGRDPIVAVEILGSALRAGNAAKDVQNKYVQCSAKAAEKLLAQELPSAAADLCRRALLLRADSAELAGLLRRAEPAERRAEAEAKALLAELARNPGNDFARFTLGETYRKLGRVDDAFAQYRTIVEGKVPFDGGTEKIDDLRRFIKAKLTMVEPAPDAPPAPGLPDKPQVAAVPGFEILAYDPVLGKQLLEAAPAIAKRVAADLACPLPAATCRISVLRTKADFAAQTGNAYGGGYSSGNSVWTYHGAAGILDNVIPHELAHVICEHAFAGGLPAWLGEGLAIRQEAAAGTYWQVIRDGGPMKLADLLAHRGSANKEENDRFYASAYSLVDMLLNDGGTAKIHRLATALKASPPEPAFREVYGIRSLQELEDRWVKHLQN